MENISPDFSTFRLGQEREPIHWQNRGQQGELATSLAAQARRNLSIFSYDLAPAIYDQPEFIEAVKQLAVGSPLTEIHILLQNNERVQKQGHRLVDLARRLTSKIEIRTPHADYLDLLENYLLVDSTGFIRQKTYTRHEGEACFSARLQTGKLQALFNEIWECSEPDSALRRLYI